MSDCDRFEFYFSIKKPCLYVPSGLIFQTTTAPLVAAVANICLCSKIQLKIKDSKFNYLKEVNLKSNLFQYSYFADINFFHLTKSNYVEVFLRSIGCHFTSILLNVKFKFFLFR